MNLISEFLSGQRMQKLRDSITRFWAWARPSKKDLIISSGVLLFLLILRTAGESEIWFVVLTLFYIPTLLGGFGYLLWKRPKALFLIVTVFLSDVFLCLHLTKNLIRDDALLTAYIDSLPKPYVTDADADYPSRYKDCKYSYIFMYEYKFCTVRLTKNEDKGRYSLEIDLPRPFFVPFQGSDGSEIRRLKTILSFDQDGRNWNKNENLLKYYRYYW